MATRTQIEDTTTVSSGGGTSTSDIVNLDNEESISVQFQGDVNSTDLTFRIEAKVDGLDEWAQLDELANKDLTANNTTNPNEIVQYDVLDLEQVRIATTNNAASNTTIDIITSHTDQQ